MWYPSQKQQQQQQQYSWYGYAHHPLSQQQQAYSRTSHYCNVDESPSTYVVALKDENESPVHCQTAYDGKKKVIEIFLSNDFI